MKILKISHNHNKVINSTLKTLKLGGLVVFPSDTVYGLLVDATNEEAVRKLIEFKNEKAQNIARLIVEDVQKFSAKSKYSDDKTIVVVKRIK